MDVFHYCKGNGGGWAGQVGQVGQAGTMQLEAVCHVDQVRQEFLSNAPEGGMLVKGDQKLLFFCPYAEKQNS